VLVPPESDQKSQAADAEPWDDQRRGRLGGGWGALIHSDENGFGDWVMDRHIDIRAGTECGMGRTLEVEARGRATLITGHTVTGTG
jgi:hypothetical protein